MQPLIITLDGPAGSGKSTVARLLAQRLGLEFLDTGAMYRAITAYCLDRGIDPKNKPAVAQAAQSCRLRFDWREDPPVLQVNDQPMVQRLRDADVTASVSDVAANGPVRLVLVESQRQIGLEHPRLVTEGRDQGSVVFPKAQVKFYLDATPRERARRRALQLRQEGRAADEEEILQLIIVRDQKDSTRADSPLTCPADAVRVDTSNLGIQEVVALLEKMVTQRLDGPQTTDPHGAGKATGQARQ
ncbi:MAG: (d)CMP kinase [Phycisphaeraceae bacterium]|nr:(d)CMP kinase [Phycisphaeraceae bacterium]